MIVRMFTKPKCKIVMFKKLLIHNIMQNASTVSNRFQLSTIQFLRFALFKGNYKGFQHFTSLVEPSSQGLDKNQIKKKKVIISLDRTSSRITSRHLYYVLCTLIFLHYFRWVRQTDKNLKKSSNNLFHSIFNIFYILVLKESKENINSCYVSSHYYCHR